MPENLQVTETWCVKGMDVIGGLLGAVVTVARLVAHQTRSIKIEKTQSQTKKFKCFLDFFNQPNPNNGAALFLVSGNCTLYR